MDIIYEKIVSAQNGNEPAMLELIEQFSPLLKKYAYLGSTEKPGKLAERRDERKSA